MPQTGGGAGVCPLRRRSPALAARPGTSRVHLRATASVWLPARLPGCWPRCSPSGQIARTGWPVSWTGSYCHLPGEWLWRQAWSGHVRDGKVVMQPGFAASEIDTSKPHPARMYDAYLGGNDNYPVDREAVREVVRLYPEVRSIALANRAFLQRAVRFLAGEAGIRQFLDIGTGIPSAGNVHEVAGRAAPGARVVYVDNDPIVHVHANALLTGSGTTTIVLADLRDPHAILADPKLRSQIDFTRPVGLLLVAILHFIASSEDPAGILAT